MLCISRVTCSSSTSMILILFICQAVPLHTALCSSMQLHTTRKKRRFSVKISRLFQCECHRLFLFIYPTGCEYKIFNAFLFDHGESNFSSLAKDRRRSREPLSSEYSTEKVLMEWCLFFAQMGPWIGSIPRWMLWTDQLLAPLLPVNFAKKADPRRAASLYETINEVLGMFLLCLGVLSLDHLA